MPPRVFLDSNVWFSAFYGSKNCERLVDAFKQEKISVVISQQILQETTRNFKEKIPFQLPNFKKFILGNPPEIVSDSESSSLIIKTLVAEEDQPIIAAAIVAKVDYFITGNIRDFQREQLEKLTSIKILTPKEAVKTLSL